VLPEFADAVSVTGVPGGNNSVQSAPQLIPAGIDVTMPPLLETVSVGVGSNAALTETTLLTKTVHTGFVPVHAPLQPVKRGIDVSVAALGVAVSVTMVPALKSATQPMLPVAAHAIPEGTESTRPNGIKEPAIATSIRGLGVKLATTVLRVVVTTWQGATVGQAISDQPENTESASGVAVSVTVAPSPKSLAHKRPQLIPAGILVTVLPEPPSLATVRVNGPLPNSTLKVMFAFKGKLQVALALIHVGSIQRTNWELESGIAANEITVPDG
jgi:hypothetical protein